LGAAICSSIGIGLYKDFNDLPNQIYSIIKINPKILLEKRNSLYLKWKKSVNVTLSFDNFCN
jgi:glycerol kinase